MHVIMQYGISTYVLTQIDCIRLKFATLPLIERNTVFIFTSLFVNLVPDVLH